MTNSPLGALRRVVPGLIVLTILAACARTGRVASGSRWSADLSPLRLAGDTGIVDTIARGVLHRAFVVRQGPWAVHVLDIDRNACWTPVAAKGVAGAIGRTKTSEIALSVSRSGSIVAGAVNADFFLFDPPGLPTGAHVSAGRVITGPATRPVFGMTTDGHPIIGTMSVLGFAVSGRDSTRISSWNRFALDGLAWFDAGYGPAVDTLSGTVRVVMSAMHGIIQSIESSLTRTPIPSSGGVLVIGPLAPPMLRERFLTIARSRGRMDIEVRLRPIQPAEVVGGFPILVSDSMEVPGLDSAGAPTFAPVRHPRTIVGVASGGRRLLLITVDGRQAGYSVGTTNRESAQLARDLGATEAINLDGGGSTTMVVARSDSGATRFEVVNRPSDPLGERAVGNALVVVQRPACR